MVGRATKAAKKKGHRYGPVRDDDREYTHLDGFQISRLKNADLYKERVRAAAVRLRKAIEEEEADEFFLNEIDALAAYESADSVKTDATDEVNWGEAVEEYAKEYDIEIDLALEKKRRAEALLAEAEEEVLQAGEVFFVAEDVAPPEQQLAMAESFATTMGEYSSKKAKLEHEAEKADAQLAKLKKKERERKEDDIVYGNKALKGYLALTQKKKMQTEAAPTVIAQEGQSSLAPQVVPVFPSETAIVTPMAIQTPMVSETPQPVEIVDDTMPALPAGIEMQQAIEDVPVMVGWRDPQPRGEEDRRKIPRKFYSNYVRMPGWQFWERAFTHDPGV